jgi:hypothetical protein
MLQELEKLANVPEASCVEQEEFAETNQVALHSITGLWFILCGFLGIAAIAGAASCVWLDSIVHALVLAVLAVLACLLC